MQLIYMRPLAAPQPPPRAIDYSAQLSALITIGSQVLEESIKHNQVVPTDYEPILAKLGDVLQALSSLQSALPDAGAVPIAGLGQSISALHAQFMAEVAKIVDFQPSILSAFAALGDGLAATITAQSDQVEALLSKLIDQNQLIQLAISSCSYLVGDGGCSIEVAQGHLMVSLTPYDELPHEVNGVTYNSNTQWAVVAPKGTLLPRYEIDLPQGMRFTLICHSDNKLGLAAPIIAGTVLAFVPDAVGSSGIAGDNAALRKLADNIESALA